MAMPSSRRSAQKVNPPPNPGQGLASLSAVESALIDYRRGVNPTDVLEAQVRQEFLVSRAKRDPFFSQAFVESVNLGRGMAAQKWCARCARQERLQQQTEELAAALERTGIPARRDVNEMVIDVMTGAMERANGYRSIRFLPLIAQRDRRPMLNAFEVFRRALRGHGKYVRLLVMTAGLPISLGGLPPAKLSSTELKKTEYFTLRDGVNELSRLISRWAQTADQVHDVDFLFRGAEFTLERRGDDDFYSVHLHANLLIEPRRRLSEKEWAAFLESGRQYFGDRWWKDCGRLRNPNEAIKYPWKPLEIDARRIGDAGVRWIYEQTFGLPMMQPLGAFRAWCKDTFWIVELDADGKSRRRRTHKAGLVDFEGGPILDVIALRRRIGKRRDPHKIVRKNQPPRENLLCNITMPQRRFSPWASPVARVLNYTASPITVDGQETLDRIEAKRRALLPNWYMNGAPDPQVALAVGRAWATALEGDIESVVPFIVHTRSSTASPRSSRGPPIAVCITAADKWQQLGVDFSVADDFSDDFGT